MRTARRPVVGVLTILGEMARERLGEVATVTQAVSVEEMPEPYRMVSRG